MSKTRMVLLRIAGSVVGSVVGSLVVGVPVFLVTALVMSAVAGPVSTGDMTAGSFVVFLFGPLGFPVGAIIGAARGATVAQKASKQGGSFWRALLGTVIGLLVGVLSVVLLYGLGALTRTLSWFIVAYIAALPTTYTMMIAGAVIGSGWKAEPSSSPSGVTRPQQGVISPGDTLKQHPQVAKCPFCASTTFHVVKEAGSRRCSDCHSVLPNYILGNP